MKLVSASLLITVILTLCLSACSQNTGTTSEQQQKANINLIKKELASRNKDVIAIFSKYNKDGRMKGVIRNTITVDTKGKVTKCVIASTQGNLSAKLINELMQYYSALKFSTRDLLSYTWMMALE